MKYTIEVDQDGNATVTCTTQSNPPGFEAHAVIFTGPITGDGLNALDEIRENYRMHRIARLNSLDQIEADNQARSRQEANKAFVGRFADVPPFPSVGKSKGWTLDEILAREG